MISFACPNCNKCYSVKDDFAGRTTKCICGQRFRVPAPAVTYVPPPVAALVAPPMPLASPFEVCSPETESQPTHYRHRPRSFASTLALAMLAVILIVPIPAAGLFYFYGGGTKVVKEAAKAVQEKSERDIVKEFVTNNVNDPEGLEFVEWKDTTYGYLDDKPAIFVIMTFRGKTRLGKRLEMMHCIIQHGKVVEAIIDNDRDKVLALKPRIRKAKPSEEARVRQEALSE
jgi:hypothetical protein